jgi:hypothetical protein
MGIVYILPEEVLGLGLCQHFSASKAVKPQLNNLMDLSLPQSLVWDSGRFCFVLLPIRNKKASMQME